MKMEDPNKFNIKTFKFIKEFIIEIQFEDGKTQTIDFQKFDHPGWWKELNDPTYFRTVKLNEMKNLEWEHGQDFKPEHFYYWEEYEKYYLPKS